MFKVNMFFNTIPTLLNTNVKAAPLAVFRVFFGLLMFISTLRFWAKGWIEEIYIQPKFYFSYYGFEFIQPLGQWTYLLFLTTGISAIGILLGYKYRLSSICFFLSFVYIELIDKTTYLNHYYFVSILSLILIFLPLNAQFSLDAYYNPKKYYRTSIPKWYIGAIQLLLGIVYVYAGLAKINSDWLLDAQPLKIWLVGKYDFPILGKYFKYSVTHYLFSWFGMLYDLCIPFILLYKPLRKLGYITVVVFHITTHLLFPIGMFPYIMITSTLIFFSEQWHVSFLKQLQRLFRIKDIPVTNTGAYSETQTETSSKTSSKSASKNKMIWKPQTFFTAQNLALRQKYLKVFFAVFFTFQLLFPWRYVFYADELFWHEQGYRFSWRVMLIEKEGYAVFTIVNPETGASFEIQNRHFLTNFQIKQMSTQPDFILQYAHKLRDHYIKEGIPNPEVYVKSYVTLNGRMSKLFIDPTVNLSNQRDSFAAKPWILPFKDVIYGL